jgi:hypothetical protein
MLGEILGALRDRRTPGQQVAARVPSWPGSGRTWTASRAGTAAAWSGGDGSAGRVGDGQHAREVWEGRRRYLVSRAARYGRAADLAFLAELGQHVETCPRTSCGDWLAWAVCQSDGLRDVFEALGGSAGAFPPGWREAVQRRAAIASVGAGRQAAGGTRWPR